MDRYEGWKGVSKMVNLASRNGLLTPNNFNLVSRSGRSARSCEPASQSARSLGRKKTGRKRRTKGKKGGEKRERKGGKEKEEKRRRKNERKSRKMEKTKIIEKWLQQ